MRLSEAADFRDESVTLFALVNTRAPADFECHTQFKGWTVNDVLVHLHFWNIAVDLSLRDEAEFKARLPDVAAAAAKGSLRAYENARVALRGRELANSWMELVEDIASHWSEIDPKRRLLWFGPSMSARSAMTARQMETWAHGFEVFDLFGATRNETDRIRNIVVLGVNTFGWSHQVHSLPVPPKMPELMLTAPSGAAWTFGEPGAGRISGTALDFAAVVTQTRALKNTALSVEGDIARIWMENAQCFAGPPEAPPAPGSRHRQDRAINAR
jgi:uncharacterized protein (TIGR03084 family)